MKSIQRSRASDGFTVIETAVAITVAAIVLTMAVTVVFSFHSSGLKISSKREVSENTRLATSRILKDLGSAQSLLRCTVWKSSELQIEYETYIRRIENNGDDPSTPVIESGSPSFSGSSADCLEYYESGNVLLRVLPNSVCWFQDLTPTNDEIDYTKPFQAACMFRGGAGRDANYNQDGLDIGYGSVSTVPMPCTPGTDQATSEDKIYYLECRFTDPSIHYFVPQETTAGNWAIISGSFREVLDLGEGLDNTDLVRKNIFSYVNSSGTNPNLTIDQAGDNTNDILYVSVNMDVRYKTNAPTPEGESDERTYKFSQTLLLQGAKTYSDEGAYSDRFTG